MTSGAPPKTISVLLVEDSPLDGRLLLEAIRGSMTAGEVVVQSVKTLAAAKAELQKFSFSCVLLDLGLPDGRGTGNVSALREIDKTAAIIVLTGLDDERSATESLKLGAQDYLIKGETDGEKLMKLIRHAVQRNRQTVQLEVRRDSTFFDASHDHLTLLPNRSLFLDRARVHLASARILEGHFGLMILIVDGIDAARTQYGGGVADELVQRIAQVMSEPLRSSDTLARVEANEFALLLQPASDPLALTAKGELLNERVQTIKTIGNCAVQVSLRLGIVHRIAEETLDTLMEQAHKLASLPLSEAPVAASNTLDAAAASEVAALPALVTSGVQLLAKWRPWADVAARRWLGLEFVPEWPDGSGLFHAQTLSTTEAVELTLTAADVLARQWRVWRGSAFAVPLLALRLPAAALRDASFPQQLKLILDSQGMPHGQLQLDIEESAFKDGGSYIEALNALHSGGFVLCLAGDGSMEVNLGDMVRLPVSSFKLSSGFLAALLEEGLQGPARRFLMALMGAAQALGSNIIAGAVDSRDALTTLQLVGVTLMQGNTLTPPVSSAQVPQLWESPVALS